MARRPPPPTWSQGAHTTAPVAPPPTTTTRAPRAAPTGAPQLAPQVAWDDDDLKRRSKMITKLFPSLRKQPNTLHVLASQDIPDDHLTEQVLKTVGFEMIQRQAKLLPKMNGDEQRKTWDDAPPVQRKMLKQAGYKGPPEDNSSILDNLTDAVTDLPGVRAIKDITKGHYLDAVGDVPLVGMAAPIIKGEGPLEIIGRGTGIAQMAETASDVGGGLADVGGAVAGEALRNTGLDSVANLGHTISSGAERDIVAPALRLANTVGGSFEQMYRLNAELGKNQAGLPSLLEPMDPKDPTNLKINVAGLHNTSGGQLLKTGAAVVTGDEKQVKHFTDAWETTAVGNRYFNDASKNQASEILDGDPWDTEAATQIAGGSKPEDIAKRYGAPGTPEYQDAYLRVSALSTTDAFTRAVKTLNNGHVSPGADIVRGIGLQPGEGPGMALSMATDAVVGWYTDPLIFAGKVRAAWKAKEAIQTEEGIRVALSKGTEAVEQAFGSNWEARYKAGELSYNQIVGADKRMATAAEMANVFVDHRKVITGTIDETTRANPLYDFFHLRFPQFEKTQNAMLDFHNKLIETRTNLKAEELGRDLTLEEHAAIPGISDSRDIWDFYRSKDGLMNLAGGDWQPGAIGNFYLPAISRTGKVFGESRAIMTTAVNQLAARGTGAALGLEEVIPGGVEGMQAAADALPDVAEGHTRLFRVQVGSDLFGESRGGRDAEKTIWHDSIERARMTGLGLGKFGQFTYIDVPEQTMTRATDITGEALKNVGVTDWQLPLEAGLDPIKLGPVGEWAEIGGKVSPATSLLAAPARLIEMLMARVPQGNTIRLWGNDTPTQLSRLLDMEYGGAVKGELYDAIMSANSPIMRREMVRSAMDRIFYNNGMYVDETARDVAAGYLNGTKQRYALDDLDMISMGSSRNPAGIGPWSDHGDEIQLPDWKLMGKQSQRMGVLHTVLGPSQAEMWDAVMGRFWKPAMLFRFGFAPRAAAEEAIVTLLRAPHVYTEGALLRMAKAGGEPVATYRDMSRLAKGMEIYMPGEIANDALMHPLDKLVHYLPNYAQGWIRGAATRALDPNTLRGAQIMAEHGPIQHAIVDMMSQVGSSRANWDLPSQMMDIAGRREPMYYIATSEEGLAALEEARATGEAVTHPDIRVARKAISQPRVYTQEEPVVRGMVFNQTDRAMKDHVQRSVADARQLFIHESQAEAALGPLTTRGVSAVSGHDALRQVRESVAQNDHFRGVYREYIHALQRSDADALTESLHLELQQVALDSGDQNLIALADAARTLPPGVAQTMLLDKNRVLAQLARPEVPLDVIEHQENGAALAIDPHRYTSELIDSLPAVEEGKVRVYARAGTAADEKVSRETVRQSWADTATEEVPWKHGSYNPSDITDRVHEDLTAAKAGRATHTDHLVYVDVDPHSVIHEDGMPVLTQAHRDQTVTFGTDIGTQLEDIRNWTHGVDGARANRWSQLADDALMGDATAARELGIETAKRQLQNPVNLRRVREMDRGIMDAEGNLVASPLREGYVRVYYPTFKAEEADAAFLAVDSQSSTGRRFVAKRDDLSPTAVQAHESVGDGPLFAQSRFASTDADEIRQLTEQIEGDARKVGQHLNVGMSYKDVPEEDVYKYWNETNGAGSHDAEISFADSLTGTPVDLDRRTITIPGHAAQPPVLQNGITFEQAMDSYAQVLNNRFDQIFDHEGRVIHELTVPGTEAKGIDPMWVFRRNTPMPPRVLGPQFYTPDAPSIIDRIYRKGMDAAITPLTNAVSRNPLFLNNAMRRVGFSENLLRPFLSDEKLVSEALKVGSSLGVHGPDALFSKLRDMPTSLKEVQGLVDSGVVSKQWLKLTNEEFNTLHDFRRNEQMVRETIGERAAHGALGDTIPYIDSHEVRSQFADEVRNLIPFWWAQEAFFRRWATTIVHTPEAIRKAQLIMQGARHAGIVHKDDQGRDIFMVPYSNWLMTQANKPISAFFGGPAQLPIPVGISGDIRMATPGFDAVGVPGFGPLVGIPLATARRLFPEVGAIEKGILGERGSGRNELEHIFPGWAVNIFKALNADPSSDTKDPQVASASIMAMQYLEANGHGLKNDATPHEQQQWVDRVTHWARSMLITRALVSNVDPAPPELSIGDPEISAEFVGLMKNLGIHEALSEMVKRHPDATAYTIFQTKSKSGNLLPATVEAQDFMEKNRDFIDKYQYFSGWMLPQSKDHDENVRAVRALQKELGLKEMKTPEMWYTDFKFGEAADVYFNSKQRYEITKEKAKDARTRADIDQSWADWKKKYFDQHPIFQQEINTTKGQDRRATVLEEMHAAYSDPNMPDFEHKAVLKTVMDSYDRYNQEMGKLSGKRGSKVSATRKDINEQFAAWGVEYTTSHPEIKLFWQRIIYPDIDLTGSDRVHFDTSASGAATNTASATIAGAKGGGGGGGGGGPATAVPSPATNTAVQRDGLPVLQPTGKEKPKVFKGDKHPGLWQVQQQQLADLQRQYPGADITMVDNSHRKGGGQWWVTPDPDPDKKYVPVKRPASRTV